MIILLVFVIFHFHNHNHICMIQLNSAVILEVILYKEQELLTYLLESYTQACVHGLLNICHVYSTPLYLL